jgi:hypothetical protein
MFSFFFTSSLKSIKEVSPLTRLHREPTTISSCGDSFKLKTSTPLVIFKETKSTVLNHFSKFFNRLNRRNLFNKTGTKSLLLFYYKKKISVFKRLTKWALSLLLGSFSTKMSRISSIAKLSNFFKNYKRRQLKSKGGSSTTSVSFFSQLKLLKRRSLRNPKFKKQQTLKESNGNPFVGFRTFLFKLSKKGSNKYSNSPTFFKRSNKFQLKKRNTKVLKFTKFTRLFGTPKLWFPTKFFILFG